MSDKIIEDLRAGRTRCGTEYYDENGYMIAEIRLRDPGDDAAEYHSLADQDGFLTFYTTDESTYDIHVDTPDDWEAVNDGITTMYADYESFYEALESDVKDESLAFVMKLLCCLIQADADELTRMRTEYTGRAAGSFSLPVCDAENRYLSAKRPKGSEFYRQCVKDFHQTARELGAAAKGPIVHPQLLEAGDTVVRAYLGDEDLRAKFGFSVNPWIYYSAIMNLIIFAGIAVADRYNRRLPVDADYLRDLIRDGPFLRNEQMMERLPEPVREAHGTAFSNAIFERWRDLTAPFMDPDDLTGPIYIRLAFLAAFQLGVSVAMEQYFF